MIWIVQFSDLKNYLASQFILLSLHVFAMMLSVVELPQLMKSIPERDKALENSVLTNLISKIMVMIDILMMLPMNGHKALQEIEPH